jgi:hypothetical protein
MSQLKQEEDEGPVEASRIAAAAGLMKYEPFKAAYRDVFNKVPTEQRAAFLSAGPSLIMGVNCNTLLVYANELIADGTNFNLSRIIPF